MILRLIFLTGFVGSALWAADEITLPTLKVGSAIYSNVTVTSVNATEIYFQHSRGLANAKLKSLEPELQEKFHYDPEKASAAQHQEADANARYTQAAQEAARASSTPEPEPEPVPVENEPVHIPGSFLNQPAPTLVIQKWLTEQPDVSGKFVLVEFWATWCGPCRRSIPHLNELSHKFRDRLVVIGLSDENEATVRRMTSPTIDYTVAIDTQNQSFGNAGITAIPHALVIDPKGIVRFEGHPGLLDEPRLLGILNSYKE